MNIDSEVAKGHVPTIDDLPKLGDSHRTTGPAYVELELVGEQVVGDKWRVITPSLGVGNHQTLLPEWSVRSGVVLG